MSHNKEEAFWSPTTQLLTRSLMERKHNDNNYYGFENVTPFNWYWAAFSAGVNSSRLIIMFQINIGQWHARKLMGSSINVLWDCSIKVGVLFFQNSDLVWQRISQTSKKCSAKRPN